MNISLEALTVLMYLTPGFFASMIMDLTLVRKDKDSGSRIFESLIFSLIIYGLAAIIVGRFPVSVSTLFDGTGKVLHRAIDFDSGAILPIILASLVLPMISGHCLTAQWLMKVLRKLRITGRTGRESTWLDVFLDQKRYVIVNLSDGRRLFGWPQY